MDVIINDLQGCLLVRDIASRAFGPTARGGININYSGVLAPFVLFAR